MIDSFDCIKSDATKKLAGKAGEEILRAVPHMYLEFN